MEEQPHLDPDFHDEQVDENIEAHLQPQQPTIERSPLEKRMIKTFETHGSRRFHILRSAERPIRQYERPKDTE